MSKKVHKYGTGDVIPENAQYLNTIVEEGVSSHVKHHYRLVWHYFLIEVADV